MHSLNRLLYFTFLSCSAFAADKAPDPMKIPVSSQTTPTDTTNKRVQESPHGDSSNRNQIHDGEHAVSAADQSNDKADVEITRKIRQAVVKDKAFSTYARNIKIITVQGRVVLKGPVRNNDEKLKVEQMAKDVAGQDNVLSEIEVTR